MNTSIRRRYGMSVSRAALIGACMLSWGTLAHAGGMPAVDGDEALRCAVARATDMAAVTQLHDLVAASAGAMEALRAAAQSGSVDETHRALLAGLGLIGADDASVTAMGERVLARADAGPASNASVPLILKASRTVTLEQPGAVGHVVLDATGSGGDTIVVTVTPHAAENGDCAAGFDPVVRATLADMPDMQPVARASGADRAATLYLHNIADGARVELAIADVVGAPGSFDVSARTWPAETPADAGMGLLAVSDGAIAYERLDTQGDRAVIGVSIEESYDRPTLRIQGLAGSQPGVRVYASDASGNVEGDPVLVSDFVATPDATVDLAALGPGYYAVTVEDLAGRPGTFLVAYSSSGSGAGFRVAGTLEIGGESAQILGSDLAFSVDEAGWYAFSTWSYDEVDPVMTLTDSTGMELYYNDDAAFGLHPLIVAQLQPGDYSLSIDGFDNATGDITLGAWRFEPQTLDMGTVSLQQQVANDLSQPNFNAYLIPVVGNELVDIDVEGQNDFDSTLALYDTSDMTVWNADDDGGIGYGSRIIDSFDGLDLLAVVASYDGARGGAYNISVVDHAKMENIAETAVAIRPAGPEALGNLASESDVAWFRVDPTEGWHTVTVNSEDMPYLNIDLFAQETDGYYWLDTAEGYDGATELSFEGDPGRAMFILVRNTSGDGLGDFRISLD